MPEAEAAETTPDDALPHYLPHDLPPDLPMWEITKTAYDAVFGDLKHVYLLAWKPLLATVAFGFIMGFCDGFLHRGFGQEPVLARTFGVLGDYWTNAYFALAFHRFQLFGWTAETSKVHFRIGRAEGLFLLFATMAYVLYGFLPGYFAMSDAHFTYMLWIVVAVLGVPVSIMFALTFPAIAASHPRPFAQGWKLGIGSWWAIFGVMIACILPGAFLQMFAGPFMQKQPFLTPLIMGIISYPFTALFIAALCATYKLKTGAPTHAPAPATPLTATAPAAWSRPPSE
jgi:hypothetical protein